MHPYIEACNAKRIGNIAAKDNAPSAVRFTLLVWAGARAKRTHYANYGLANAAWRDHLKDPSGITKLAIVDNLLRATIKRKDLT